MGFGFRLPRLPSPPSPPWVPPMAAKVIAAPVSALSVGARVIAEKSPIGGFAGTVLRKTADTAEVVSARATESASAMLVGDLNTAARRGLQAVAEPSKASNRATVEAYSKIPGPLRTVISTVVGTVFPVSQFVFMALDLQLAANARKIAKLKAAQAKAELAEIEALQAEIRQLEAETAAIQADRDKQARATGEAEKKPSFKESLTYAWLNAFNKAKE